MEHYNPQEMLLAILLPERRMWSEFNICTSMSRWQLLTFSNNIVISFMEGTNSVWIFEDGYRCWPMNRLVESLFVCLTKRLCAWFHHSYKKTYRSIVKTFCYNVYHNYFSNLLYVCFPIYSDTSWLHRVFHARFSIFML